MRKLVVTRGPQGAGKSTTVRELGLDAYRLSADDLRRLYSSPVLRFDGHLTLNHDFEERVWRELKSVLNERMGRGELIVVDATHPCSGSFKPYLEAATLHRYQVVCLDFSTIPLELAQERNAARHGHEVVPAAAVERTWQRCRDGQVPQSVERIYWSADGSHVEKLGTWLHEPIVDLSSYERVHHIGDLQGCFTPLAEYLGPDGLKDDELYIFVGDLCDRGIQNGQVVRWMLAHASDPNVVVIWGNHEEHLHRYGRGLLSENEEFNQRTVPQLVGAGITRAEIDGLCDSFVDCICYVWNGQRVIVTHAGLSTVPEHRERIASRQYAKGTGHYSDPIDDQFTAQAPDGWLQVHGHRNLRLSPVKAAARSFNLEGAVEYGGHLRIVVLEATGWVPVEVKSRVYRPLQERLGDRVLPFRELLPPWLTAEMAPPVLSPQQLAALQAHALFQEKIAPSRPHISAFNFTREAFFDTAWDTLTITPRGLFVDNGSGEIIARSYDKFFNLGERPETAEEALATSLTFPVAAYLKENGYLGILGYDARCQDLLWTSKSSPDSEFSRWFQELGEAVIGPTRVKALARYLRDTGSAMAFQVVAPVRDPHICEYDQPVLVLLDVIRRAPVFQALPYEQLLKVGEVFGLTVKDQAMTFHSWKQLSGWLRVAQRPDYKYRGRPVEGFVLEDASGFQVKI